MTDDQVRQTLLWLAEQVEKVQERGGPLWLDACAACGHSRRAHSVGGDADNPMPWPCEYPKHLGAPTWLCTCPDYQPVRDD